MNALLDSSILQFLAKLTLILGCAVLFSRSRVGDAAIRHVVLVATLGVVLLLPALSLVGPRVEFPVVRRAVAARVVEQTSVDPLSVVQSSRVPRVTVNDPVLHATNSQPGAQPPFELDNR